MNKVYEIRVEECKVSAWTDVSDSLPKETGRYWCYVEYTSSTGLSCEQQNCAFNAESKTWSDENWNGGEKVIYWRDLMEVPSKDECETGCNEKFLNIARESAFHFGMGHSYTPKTKDGFATFEPHDWVMVAIERAATDAYKSAFLRVIHMLYIEDKSKLGKGIDAHMEEELEKYLNGK
jgi:hypothetical protein